MTTTMSRTEAEAVVGSIRWSRPLFANGRRAEEHRLYLPEDPRADELIKWHDQHGRYEPPLGPGQSPVRPLYRLLDAHVDADELEAYLAGAGPVLRLLHAYGLRLPVRITWHLSVFPDRRAIWDPAAPQRWRISYGDGDLPQSQIPPPLDDPSRLLLARPGGMPDAELLATLPARVELRRIVDRAATTRANIHPEAVARVTALWADAIRTLADGRDCQQ